MALYFKDIEITNIDNLVPQTGLDITDIWFGSTNVYTVWETYEGTLPATFNANGDDMRQYRFYGAAGGVGDKTVQLFDMSTTIVGEGLGINGQIVQSSISNRSDFIKISPRTTYTRKYNMNDTTGRLVQFYNANKIFIGETEAVSKPNPILTFVTPNSAEYLLLAFPKDSTQVSLTSGSTAPASYVPYGYEVNISTSDGTSTTTMPIYIGNNPLEKVGNYSDYVDYELQKVVRAIKKYVLTGNENWEEITGAFPSRKYFRWIFAPINYCIRHVCVSSHFTQATITTSTTTVGFDVFDSSTVGGDVLAIRPTNIQSTTLADFKSYLAAQYAAGTPVTIWCALTTAEEADPPVPLPALPTCEGETVVDYAGESVAPEKVMFKYRKEGF